eukprot:jgi/Tetstr1/437537/TSEL_026209.t1
MLERIASFGTSGYGCHHGAMQLMVVCAVRQTSFLGRMMPPSELDPFLEAVDVANISATFRFLVWTPATSLHRAWRLQDAIVHMSMPGKGWIASVSKDGVYSCKHCRGNVTGTCEKMARERHFLKFPNCSHSLKRAAKLRRKAALSQAAAAGAAAAAAATTGAAAGVAAAVGNGPPAPVSDDGGSKVDDVMGVGEDPVGEDGMDIDAPAWPPAGVEPAMRA